MVSSPFFLRISAEYVIFVLIQALLSLLFSVVALPLILLTGLWSFWSSGNIWGIRFARNVISETLSGALIPLSLFPLWLKNIADILPFQAIYSTPLLIYIGQISGSDLLSALEIQVFWIALLGSISFIVWKLAEKKTISYGG